MEENELININNDDIKSLIYTIRGKQVMLDSDLAKLYHCKNGTKTINQAVRRNIARFPERFRFQISEEEYNNMWSQFGTTTNSEKQKYRRKENLPYAFTEQGVAMLATVIKTDVAVAISIRIMDAFVDMKKIINLNGQLMERVTNMEYKLLCYDKKFEEIFNQFQITENVKQKLFFQGQIWDSYELIIDIIKKAQNKILIIDNYIHDTILKMLQKKNKNVEVTILTSQNCTINKLDIKKFNEQYPTLKIARSNKFHDRFIVVDSKDLYHCGASLKDLGKKCFAISKIEDSDFLDNLIEATP